MARMMRMVYSMLLGYPHGLERKPPTSPPEMTGTN